MVKLKVFTDGGARGNPGPAAIGVIIRDEQGKELAALGQTIGRATNNVAEYKALIKALELLKQQPPAELVEFFLDSTLVVNQVMGNWKIKQPHLAVLAAHARKLAADLKGKVSFQAVPREKNRQADALVNRALDKC